MKRFWIILAALALLRLVLMATMPVFDPSEARYAAISANMARTGDFVVPHFTYKGVYQSFDGKPPLVFQASGLCCKFLGVNTFAVRLFPFLSACLLLTILYQCVRRRTDKERARLAVLIAATSTAFYAAAGISMTDMTLALCVAGALLLYHRFAETRAWCPAFGVAALLGAGMIVKGPVALVLFGFPVFIDALVNRRWKTLFSPRWFATLPLFLLIAVPWFVLIEKRNPGSVWYFFYNENFLRFVSHDYGDRYGAGREAFRGVSVLWAFVVTLPWSLLILPHIKKLRPAALRSLDFSILKSFELLATLSIIGFWCLTSRVLVYYLFPIIPLVAALAAERVPTDTLKRRALPAAAISAAVVLFALLGGALFSDKMEGAKAAFSTRGSRYSYEFYHGTHPSALKTSLK